MTPTTDAVAGFAAGVGAASLLGAALSGRRSRRYRLLLLVERNDETESEKHARDNEDNDD